MKKRKVVAEFLYLLVIVNSLTTGIIHIVPTQDHTMSLAGITGTYKHVGHTYKHLHIKFF